MAELLVRAKKHWMDDLTQKQVDAMTKENKASYEARSQIGDVIVVRPDGWKWGKCECLPDFVVVKVPDMTVDEAKKYEESLHEDVVKTVKEDGKDVEKTERILIRKRKYSMPTADVATAISAKVESVELTKSVAISKVSAKTGLASEITTPKAEEKP